CLASVRRQTEPGVELLVVDNHSRDATAEIARRHADRLIVAGPERSRQRNLGAQAARAPWLLFVDSDMVLPPETVSECLAACRDAHLLARHPVRTVGMLVMKALEITAGGAGTLAGLKRG